MSKNEPKKQQKEQKGAFLPRADFQGEELLQAKINRRFTGDLLTWM